MKIRRALTTAAPLAIAGALGIGATAATASAAAAPVQLPSLQLPLLNGLNLTSVTSGLGLSSVTAPLSSVTGTVNSVLGGLGATAPAAAPAPAGALTSHAAANALNLGILNTCVSCTSASAGPGSASAGAHALTVLGNDLSAGSASGNDSNSGNLIALPANGLLGLAIADWMNATQSGSSSNAHSRSALSDISLANGQIATVGILEAMSNASSGGSSASGNAANNGVDLSLLNGGIALILLHSDVAADGTQTAYVASLNGNQLLATHGNSGGLPITIPGVGTINVLSSGADGGAAVSTIDNLLGSAGQAAGVLTASGGPATTASTGGNPPAGNGGSSTSAPKQPSTGAAHIPSAAANSSAPTPMTGIGLGLGGFALLAGGLGLIGATARRRRNADTV